MPTLHVALNDGFTDDAVVLRLNGHEVYSKAGLRTDLRITRAAAVDLPLDEGPAELTVEVRGHTAALTIDAARTPHITVDLSPDGHPVLRPSVEVMPML